MNFEVLEKVAMTNQPKFIETVGIIDQIVIEYKLGNIVGVEPIRTTNDLGNVIAGYRLHSPWLAGTMITAVDFLELNHWFNDDDAFEIENFGHYEMFTNLVLGVIEFLDDIGFQGEITNYTATSTTVTIEGTSGLGEKFRLFYDLTNSATWKYGHTQIRVGA
jgi:hypothetical protein